MASKYLSKLTVELNETELGALVSDVIEQETGRHVIGVEFTINTSNEDDRLGYYGPRISKVSVRLGDHLGGTNESFA
jgi:hypothetical protein